MRGNLAGCQARGVFKKKRFFIPSGFSRLGAGKYWWDCRAVPCEMSVGMDVWERCLSGLTSDPDSQNESKNWREPNPRPKAVGRFPQKVVAQISRVKDTSAVAMGFFALQPAHSGAAFHAFDCAPVAAYFTEPSLRLPFGGRSACFVVG